MDYIEKLHEEGRILLRLMDQPTIGRLSHYECPSWVNEFTSLMSDGLSITLVTPGTKIKCDKNVGYIIDTEAIPNNRKNIKLEGVVGLFVSKGANISQLLRKMYVVKRLLKHMTNTDYPIYLYDESGSLELVNLTIEQENDIIYSLGSNVITCWPEEKDKPEYIPIDFKQKEI